MAKYFIVLMTALIYCLNHISAEEIRLLDLEPNDAQNLIEKQDQTLKYAPKIDTDVPAVRYLGQEPHNVLEDIYLAKQYHGQDGLGGYLYGYQVPDIAKNEHKKAGGDLRGAYNYVNGAGQEIKVEYWDDGNGFHQIDNVPKILPTQIDDSPEVKAAKDAFLKRWHEEAERNTHPVQNPYPNQVNQYSNSGPLDSTSQYQGASQQYTQQQYQPQPAASSQQAKYAPQNNVGQYTHASQQQPLKQYPSYVQTQAASSQQTPQVFQASGTGQQQYQPVPQYQPQQALPSPQNSYIPPADQGSKQSYQLQEGASSQQSNYIQSSPASGQYNSKQIEGGEEDVTGPPKGFFYSFDYPVGIITKDQGRALPGAGGDALKNVYEQNKERFSRQLAQGWSPNGGSQYLIN